MGNIVNREFDMGIMKPLKNVQGTIVEKYIPRKCAATSKILGAKDFASVQIFVPDVDEQGRANLNKGTTFALSGYIRNKGRSDQEIESILGNKGLYPLPN